MLYTKPTYSQPHNCTSMLIYTLHTRSSLHVNSLRLPSLSLTSPSLHCTSLHFIPHFFTSLCFWTFRHHASKTLYFRHLLSHCLNGSETSGSSHRTTQRCFLEPGIRSYATVKAPNPTAIICYCWTCDCVCTVPAFTDIVTDIFFTRVGKQSKKWKVTKA